jgi:hypothetical protein
MLQLIVTAFQGHQENSIFLESSIGYAAGGTARRPWRWRAVNQS